MGVTSDTTSTVAPVSTRSRPWPWRSLLVVIGDGIHIDAEATGRIDGARAGGLRYRPVQRPPDGLSVAIAIGVAAFWGAGELVTADCAGLGDGGFASMPINDPA